MKTDGRDKRRRWLKNQLSKHVCNCGEQQPHRLMFYPHHKKIQHTIFNEIFEINASYDFYKRY